MFPVYSAAAAGGIASAVTNPLDLAKLRLQVLTTADASTLPILSAYHCKDYYCEFSRT
jgi:hypothetical protein